MMASKILITGASGFVGRSLITQLQSDQIVAIDDPLSALQHLLGCDYVVNLEQPDQGTFQEQLRVSIDSTQTLLQACVKAQVKRFIHISSTAVYGDPPPSRVITEESPYLASLRFQTSIQQATERLVLQAETGDTEVVVLQLGRVYGAGRGGETDRSLNQMKTALMPIVRQGEGYCNLIYVDDVVTAIIRACEVPNLHQQRFIVSHDSPVSWKALLSGYESILQQKSLIDLPIDYQCQPQDSIPLFRAAISQALKKRKVREGTSAIAKLFYGKTIYYPSADEFRALVAQPIFSNQKSRDRLNFQPQISLQSGIEKIREWWCQNPVETV